VPGAEIAAGVVDNKIVVVRDIVVDSIVVLSGDLDQETPLGLGHRLAETCQAGLE
jgi:hypothetical protein